MFYVGCDCDCDCAVLRVAVIVPYCDLVSIVKVSYELCCSLRFAVVAAQMHRGFPYGCGVLFVEIDVSAVDPLR